MLGLSGRGNPHLCPGGEASSWTVAPPAQKYLCSAPALLCEPGRSLGPSVSVRKAGNKGGAQWRDDQLCQLLPTDQPRPGSR